MDTESLLDDGTNEEGKDESCKEKCCKRVECICCMVCCLILLVVAIILIVRRITIGSIFHNDLDSFRSDAALELEALRRSVADRGGTLKTYNSLPHISSIISVAGASEMFPYFNFVQGFDKPGWPGIWEALTTWFTGPGPKFKPPVEGEKMGVVTFNQYSEKHFGRSFPIDFFDNYYTGERVPSWEDNERHERGSKILAHGVALARKAPGGDILAPVKKMEPRFAFDMKALSKIAWDGFRYFGPLDIDYASNGVYGISVVEGLMEKYNTTEVLGVLMSESVFSAHLTYDSSTKTFKVDLTDLDKYEPISGYARLGGMATFVEDNGRLRTTELRYGGKTYTKFDDEEVEQDFIKSKRSKWRYAEAAIIASLLSMTNLVMHVKDLHLELAATFQAVTVDAFAGEPKHPVRRLLDPFISRSVQATNDNLKLLYEYHAAAFSLAPLEDTEQLKLIDDSIKKKPLNLFEMDMEQYSLARNMDPQVFSTRDAVTNSSRWGWRWHYRALTVQRLYDTLISCWFDAEGLRGSVESDPVLKAYWKSLIDHLPSLKLAVQRHPSWASHDVTEDSFKHVARTIMVWLSWIHEDVGHSAAAYVYNPVYTPMCVPEDGVGVPMPSWVFNSVAYRGYVFLHRAELLDPPPDFWFDGNAGTRQCFTNFQEALRRLGREDPAFSECDKTGFYSCVDRVETAVSS